MWGCFKNLLLHNVHKYIPLVNYFNGKRVNGDALWMIACGSSLEGKRGYGPDLLKQGTHNI